MSNFVHNRKRRQIAAASLHILAMSGDFNAQLQFNVAEARSIAYETDAKRLLRKNAFGKADNSTRRLFGNMEEMRDSAQTPWQKQQVVLLGKLLTKARENVLAHLSDTSAQSTFILLSQFLGISPELEQVHRADHSAKMDAAGFVAKTGISFLPGAGPLLGTVVRGGMKVHSTKHSVSRRKGEEVQFDHEASYIVPTSSTDATSSQAHSSFSSFPQQEASAAVAGARRVASVKDTGSSMSPNLQRRPQTFSVGQRNVSGRGRGRRRGHARRPNGTADGMNGGARASPSRGDVRTSTEAQRVVQEPVAPGGRGSLPHNTTTGVGRADANVAGSSTAIEGVQGGEGQSSGEMSERERYEAAVELYKKQRNKLKAVLILKARDKQAKGIAQGKGSTQYGSSSARQAKPILEQKEKEASEFLRRLRRHVGERIARQS